LRADADGYGLAVATADGYVAAVIHQHAGQAASEKKISHGIGDGAGHSGHGGQVLIATARMLATIFRASGSVICGARPR